MDEPIEQEEQKLPPMNFISFLADQVTMAQLYLAGIRNPETDQVVVNLPLVKRIIDGLEILQEKTKGNLTAPESNYLANSLYELRMNYIRTANQANKSQKEAQQEENLQEDEPQTDTLQDETS